MKPTIKKLKMTLSPIVISDTNTKSAHRSKCWLHLSFLLTYSRLCQTMNSGLGGDWTLKETYRLKKTFLWMSVSLFLPKSNLLIDIPNSLLKKFFTFSPNGRACSAILKVSRHLSRCSLFSNTMNTEFMGCLL